MNEIIITMLIITAIIFIGVSMGLEVFVDWLENNDEE
jgi:hypothetical protein